MVTRAVLARRLARFVGTDKVYVRVADGAPHAHSLMEGPPLHLDGAPIEVSARVVVDPAKADEVIGILGAVHRLQRALGVTLLKPAEVTARRRRRLRRRRALADAAPTTELLSTRSRKMTYKEWKASNRLLRRRPRRRRRRLRRRRPAAAAAAAAAAALLE